MQQEVNGGSYTIGSEMPTSGGGGEYGPAVIQAGEACGCTICPVCGGCMVDDALKVAQLPGDDTPPPTFFDCEVCSCVPTVNSSALEANPKANCIYEKLISGEILQDFISRFFGPTEPNHSFLGELNLTWKLGITTETLPIGVPNNNVGYSVEIRLNETAINSGSVTNVALSMLHEALHAKLIAEVYDEVHSTDFWTLYRFYGGWGLNGLDAQQELEMLQFYSERMAQALQKIDLSLGITHSLDFYKDGIKFDLTYQLNSDGHLIDLYEEGRAEYEAIFESTKICEP